MSASTDLGKAGITVNGTWSGSVAYEKNSIVNDGADSYISIQDVPIGTALSNTAYWTLLCNGFSSAEVVSAVNAWLVAHPEATTTVQDGSITTAKLADGAVTDAKLVQSGGVLEDVRELNSAVFEESDNLFDYTQAKVNQLPNSWGGQTYNDLSTLNGWKTSNLIQVEAGKTYCCVKSSGVLGNSYIVNFYDSNGTYLSKVEMGANDTVTAPNNAAYMYMFKSGTNPDFSSPNIAIKEYTQDMDLVIRPYGTQERYITNPFTYGLYKNGTDYYHFALIAKGKYIVRHFTRFGVNNLLDLKGLYYGKIFNNNLILTSIGTISTDTIGPVSIHRGEVDSWVGSWSGGVHGITISGTEYPTAEQKSLAIYCNGEEITADGMYYGAVTIIAENDLYFPKSVTANGLTDATKAIKETRRYELKETMKVKVSLDFYATTYIVQYYGCQSTVFNMSKVVFPNNEKVVDSSPSANYVGSAKESKILMSGQGVHYDISVRDYGLGAFTKNNGTASDVGYCYLATFGKLYFVLVANELGVVRTGTTDKTFCWEAKYNYYAD